MYLQKAVITDFRCFRRAEVTFRAPEPHRRSHQQNITVVLGTNGAGKSSLLQSLALGLLSESLRDTGLRFRNLLRRGDSVPDATLTTECAFHPEVDEGVDGQGTIYTTIKQYLAGEAPMLGAVKLPNHGEEVSREIWEKAGRAADARSFFLVGYGTYRRPSEGARFELERQDRRFHLRAQRVASLFVDDLDLIPLAAWWPKSQSRLEVQALLSKVLPDVQLTTRLDERGDLLVNFRGVELPETALSDGYRSFLGWFGDLLFRLTQVRKYTRKLHNIPGIVLVDEIDLHLHPIWQQNVIDRLSEALPALQFVVTTHSPLIVGGVRRESLRVLRVGDGGLVTVEVPETETYGLSVDQILLGDSFGLTQVRPEKFIDELKKVQKVMKSGDIDAAVTYTRMLALGEAGKVRS